MIFRQLFETKSSTYTYLLADECSGEAIMIDPVVDNLDLYLQLLQELDLTLKFALDTHVHADHITALGALRDATGCVTRMGKESQVPCVSQTFEHGDLVRVGDVTLKVLYTPGHTDDSYSFYLQHKDGDRVFTGDTLLIRGTGRTDFQNGNSVDQYQSLQQLLSLPDHTLVYPAHDYKGWAVSSIAEERRWNPRLQVATAEEYVELMAALDLPNPAQMDVAVPANRQCGVS